VLVPAPLTPGLHVPRAGAASLGYFSARFAPDASALATNGYTGAVHVWRRATPRASADATAAAPALAAAALSLPPLLPEPAVTGHWAGIVDLCWAIDGECLMTASSDQTIRISRAHGGRWFEFARPQVHGHDFHAVAALPQRAASRFLYASASEEKVIRVFAAPLAFLQTLA
jgi:elongator complex protein 2